MKTLGGYLTIVDESCGFLAKTSHNIARRVISHTYMMLRITDTYKHGLNTFRTVKMLYEFDNPGPFKLL